MDGPGDQMKVERASSALADVDINGWTQRFDLLSDPNVRSCSASGAGDLAGRTQVVDGVTNDLLSSKAVWVGDPWTGRATR